MHDNAKNMLLPDSHAVLSAGVFHAVSNDKGGSLLGGLRSSTGSGSFTGKYKQDLTGVGISYETGLWLISYEIYETSFWLVS